jgi:hypothetical protein
MPSELHSEQTKLHLCPPTPNLHGAASAKPFGLYRQASPQLIVTRFDVISNFTAFECCDHGICNTPPSHGLPIHQLTNLDAQMIRLSHAVRPFVMSNGEDRSADSERFLNGSSSSTLPWHLDEQTGAALRSRVAKRQLGGAQRT